MINSDFIFGFSTGLSVSVILLAYFVHSFRKFKRDIIGLVIENMGEKDG
jgi:hypothetical protein|tara:strand:+ start:222 stop:368 length:147 start_codon:yes stop_codon:yes gene_type:complete